MEVQEFKKMLERYQRLAALKRVIERKVNEIRKEDLSAVEYGDTFHGSAISNSPEVHAVRLDCFLRKLRNITLNMTAIEARVMDIIKVLSYEEQTLIIERYLKGVAMYELANRYCYTYESLRVKYCRIFKKLEKAEK